MEKKVKKLLYIVNARIPTEKAHGIQIMKMCEAFSNIGLDVKLVVPKRINSIKKNAFEYYSVKKNFILKYLPNIDILFLGHFRFYLQTFSFVFVSFFYVLFSNVDIIYSRTEFILFPLSFFKKNLYWEMHVKSNKKLAIRTAQRVNKIITISNGLKQHLIEQGISEEKILVAHDGVDLDEFDIDKNKEEIRKELGLPLEKKIVGYVGKMSAMGEGKGVGGIIEAFSILKKKDKNVFLMLVGANESEKKLLEKTFSEFGINGSECTLLGHVPHADVPYYLKSADVLVMNYSSSEHFFSPLKLFEYMASGIPIVTSDTPNIREILSDKTAFFMEKDNVRDLSSVLQKTLVEYVEAQNIASEARKISSKYTWNNRATNIINGIVD